MPQTDHTSGEASDTPSQGEFALGGASVEQVRDPTPSGRNNVAKTPYVPDRLPVSGIDYQSVTKPVGEANAALARYDGLLQAIPNPDVVLQPLIWREAEQSSRIEGTQASVSDVLEHQAGLKTDDQTTLLDIEEITNYSLAWHHANYHLKKERAITLNLLRELHQTLLDSQRGKDKSPGKFRQGQNYIGPPRSPENASFFPPAPQRVPAAMTQWENYLKDDNEEALLQTAVMHAQFELIHPFEDGNGRIGRILIPLFLHQKGKIANTAFNISEYLEKHRREYFDRLKAISRNDDWNGWVLFFLKAVISQSKKDSDRVRAIMDLYSDTREKIQQATHSQYTLYLLDEIFSNPVVQAARLGKKLEKERGIHRATTANLLRKLVTKGILNEIYPGKGRRSALMAFGKLIRTIS